MPVAHLVDQLGVVAVDLEHVAVLQDEDVLVGDAGLARQLGVEVLLRYSPCTGTKNRGSHEVQHHAQVLLGGVAAHVDAARSP